MRHTKAIDALVTIAMGLLLVGLVIYLLTGG